MGKHAIWGYPMFTQTMFLQGTAMVVIVVARGSDPQIDFSSCDFSYFLWFLPFDTSWHSAVLPEIHC